MTTTLRWLAAIILLLAFIVFNPVVVGGLCLVVYCFGRVVNNRNPIVRYLAFGTMALTGAFIIQLIASVFPVAWLLVPFAVILTIIAARHVHEKHKIQTTSQEQHVDDEDDVIDVEVISVETITHD